jgi:hypothetical protein
MHFISSNLKVNLSTLLLVYLFVGTFIKVLYCFYSYFTGELGSDSVPKRNAKLTDFRKR